jgi:hypothetical protein
MSLTGFLIALATLVAAGIVIFWIIRTDRADAQTAKPRPKPAQTGDEKPVDDDPTSALKRAVRAGEAAAARGGKLGRIEP